MEEVLRMNYHLKVLAHLTMSAGASTVWNDGCDR